MINKETIAQVLSNIERRRRENENLVTRLEERGHDSNGGVANSDLYYTALGHVTEDLKIIHYLESLLRDDIEA